MKKFIALLISVIMILGIMPLTAFAATELSIVHIGDIASPVAGQTPDYVATYGTGYNFTTKFDAGDAHYGIIWIDTTDGDKNMTSEDVFVAGHIYRVAVIVAAQPGYSFSKYDNYTSSVSGRINGKTANVYVISGYNAGEYIGITYTFEACAYNIVTSVAVTDLNIPASGEKLDFTALPKDDSYVINSVSWKDLTTNQNMPTGSVAVAGHNYEVEIFIRVKDGCKFKVDRDGCPDVVAKIGAYNATVIPAVSDTVVGITDTYLVPDDITSVTVSGIDAPVTGATPDTTATCGSGYTITEIVWVDTTGEYKDYIYGVETFEPERKYTVQVTLETIGNYRFVMDGPYNDVSGKINNNTAIVYGSNSSTEVAIGYEFPATEKPAPTIIPLVYVNGIDAPVVGKAPDTEGTCGEGYEITEIIWVDTTGEYKDHIVGITEFEAEHKYTVQITLAVKDGYEFSSDGYYNDVTGEINMEPAIEYGTDSVTEMTIGYEFPATEKPAPTIIPSVYVNGIDAPVAGATPDMEGTCGEGYEITEIIWVDTTGEYKDYVYGITEFEVGHEYTVQITLKVKDGYEYVSDGYYNEVTAEINMQPAIEYGTDSVTELSIGYEFPAVEAPTPTVISTVYVNGIDAPEYGKAPDTEGTCGEGYEITEIVWVDTTGEYKDHVYDITEFEVGHKYTVQITLKVKDGYEFSSDGYYNDVTGEINMQPAIEYGTDSVTELAIGYEFPAVTAPEHTHEYKAVVTAPTCTEDGYTTYTCECGDTYKADVTEPTGHVFGDWVVVKKAEVGVEGKEQRKCKSCDSTEERTIPALKAPSDDILLGDINNDGKITAADARLALRISAKLETPNEYQLVAADMTLDKKITAADARKILRKSAKLE